MNVAIVGLPVPPVLIGPTVELELKKLYMVVVVVPLGAAMPPVPIGPRDEVELAKGGFDVVGVPPVPVLNGSDELTLVPVDRGPLVPVEIGPIVLVEVVLMVEDPLEELEEG